MILYGLANCDSTKAAMKWLKQKNISFTFHDYKIQGINNSKLEEWLQQIPLEELLNKRSTTWRALSPEQQIMATSKKGAIQLMKENTSLIKRPALEKDGRLLSVGFDENKYSETFSS